VSPSWSLLSKPHPIYFLDILLIATTRRTITSALINHGQGPDQSPIHPFM
jgi:hypothetical protein